jgi:hypothetical protein
MMAPVVCYLVQGAGAERGLVFPQELPKSHHAAGSFYLLGAPGDHLLESYLFHAVQADDVIETRLNRRRRGRAFFEVGVAGVGVFVFHARPLTRRVPYTGRARILRGLVALRQLQSWTSEQQENACREHQFYFVGYSPRIDDQVRSRRR